MKKLAIATVLSLLLVAVICVPAMAAAQKVDLVTCPINYPDPANQPPGGGFVVFNNPSNPSQNLVVTVALKGVEPNTAYDIYLFVDGSWYGTGPVDTVTTNKKGNANFHMNGVLPTGQHTLAIDVVYQGSGKDIYETPGIHANLGTVMTFK